MNEQLKELRRLAEVATPGPWNVGFHNEIADNLRVGNWQHELVRYRVVNVCASGSGEHLAWAKSQDLANFIAAANPSAILDLIRQLEEAQQEIARANVACEMANIAWDQSHEQLTAAQARIAKLEAQGEPVCTVGYKGMRTHSMLEVVFADGICPPAGTKLYLHAPQAVPEGWKLVPIEPNCEMCEQAFYEFDAENKDFDAANLYRAMLMVAPSPEGGAA